jgi:hypothetical protein
MEPAEQLKEVHLVLDRLTRFRYINGWAAVAAGILSITAYMVIGIYYHVPWVLDSGGFWQHITQDMLMEYTVSIGVLLVAATVICGSIILFSLPGDLTGYALRNLLKLVAIFALYIICGGALVFSMLRAAAYVNLGFLRVIPPMMCIFYGMAQLHAAYVSLPALKYLGIAMISAGLLGCAIPDLGWFLWGIAFGPGHIAIGLYVVNKKRVES